MVGLFSLMGGSLDLLRSFGGLFGLVGAFSLLGIRRLRHFLEERSWLPALPAVLSVGSILNLTLWTDESQEDTFEPGKSFTSLAHQLATRSASMDITKLHQRGRFNAQTANLRKNALHNRSPARPGRRPF